MLTILYSHIVILKQDLPSEHIDKHIEWVNEMHKGTVNGRDNADQGHGIKQTYRSDSINFHGYAGKFSDEALKKIRDHEHVSIYITYYYSLYPYRAYL